MLTQEQLESLRKVVNGGEWKLVNEILDEHVAKLSTLEGIDLTIDPQELKVELIARKKARDALSAFLSEMRGYGAQESITTPLNRSMK